MNGGEREKGKTSVDYSATRAPARPRKIQIGDLIHRLFRKPRQGEDVPPERHRDAPGSQLDAARYPTARAPRDGAQAWPFPLP